MKLFKNPVTGKLDLFWLLTVIGLTLYSAFTYLYQLASGQRSEFYASIAVSMSKSLSNWWWGASDPGGTITLDKIPGSYWVPAIFVKLFGFSTWSVNAPNAIATVVMVLVVAYTGRQLFRFRRAASTTEAADSPDSTFAANLAGLVAGAVAASTPILAAVSRSNQPESFFLLWISVAVLFGLKAVQRLSFWYLMLAGAFIALAFDSYMMVAWALWPALGIAWLTTGQPWARRIWQLLVAGFSSLVLSLVWIISVTLTPASARPYIGGSNGNSAWEMVFGYNGLGRFSSLTSGTAASTIRGFTPPFSGDPSPVRLVNSQLLPQIGWLIPAAIVAIIVLLVQRRFKPDTWFIAGHFAMFAIMFSVVQGMHQFYTAELGIGVALVLALALGNSALRNDRIGQVLILITTGITVLFIAIQYSGYLTWAPIAQLVVLVAAVVLTLVGIAGRAKFLVPVVVAAGLVLTPAAWSADVYNYPSSINPVAGPSNALGTFGGTNNFGGGMPGGNFGGGMPGGFGSNSNTASLLKYLKSHAGNAKYLMATFGTQSAAPYITASGENIVPIGGFDGSDPSPTLKTLKSWIAGGKLKYVLVNGQGMGGFGGGLAGGAGATAGGGMRFGGGMGGNSAATSTGRTNESSIQTWVTGHCTVSDYSGGGLYVCSPSSVK